MEPTKPSAEDVEALNRLISEANKIGDSAAAFSAQRLRSCVQIGSTMLAWRGLMARGEWENWCEEHLPELKERSRQRWMRLATLDKEGKLDLESARGLRHAYRLANLLPDNDSGSAKTNQRTNYLVHLSRLIRSLDLMDLEALKPRELSDLRERLVPIVKFHQRISQDA